MKVVDNLDEEYKNLINSLQKENNSPIEATDDTLLDSIESVDNDTDPEYERRNKIYTKLLKYYFKSYCSKSCFKKWYKLIFFIVIMTIFVFIIVLSLNSINNISMKEAMSIADIATLIGALASILSSLLVIPRIIAEHLFPKDEDANMIGLVKNMQLNDNEIRNWLHQPNCNDNDNE